MDEFIEYTWLSDIQESVRQEIDEIFSGIPEALEKGCREFEEKQRLELLELGLYRTHDGRLKRIGE